MASRRLPSWRTRAWLALGSGVLVVALVALPRLRSVTATPADAQATATYLAGLDLDAIARLGCDYTNPRLRRRGILPLSSVVMARLRVGSPLALGAASMRLWAWGRSWAFGDELA